MAVLRGALPLLLTGSTGLALVGFGLTGLSGVDPQLRSAAAAAERARSTPPTMQNVVHCPPRHVKRADPEV